MLPELKSLIEELSPAQQEKVLEFVKKLQQGRSSPVKLDRDRVPGLLKGKIFMSDDFDEPWEMK